MDTSGFPGYVDFAVRWFDNVVSTTAHTFRISARVLDAEDSVPARRFPGADRQARRNGRRPGAWGLGLSGE
ncbi:MAG TPA: hypothetical protein VGS79_00700 [Puia sp.]|nr:hypothetical protein [Puia sp.]